MKKPTATAKVGRDQTRTMLVPALLRDFGLHHFYLGQPFLGRLYLLFVGPAYRACLLR